MSPAASWLFLLGMFIMLYIVVIGAGRFVDWFGRTFGGRDGLEEVRRRERALDRMSHWTEDDL